MLQVFALNAIKNILIGVVSSGVVFDGVLDELESRNANRIKGNVVGATRVARSDRRGTKVGEGLQPFGED